MATIGYLAKSGGLRRIFMKMDLVDLPGTRMEFQQNDEARFRKLPNTAAEIVFAGDSLVNNGPWAEMLSEVHSRGIGGETTSGLLTRLDEITESKPKQIFLLIGTNDLANSVPENRVVRNYRTILERIGRESPKTAITVLALLPLNPLSPKKTTQTGEQVASLNRRLKELVGEFPGVQFLDLTSYLADASGNLRPEFAEDMVHINLDGYLAIRKPIEDAVKK